MEAIGQCLNEDASSVLCITETTREARSFEPVDDSRHRAGREPGMRGQSAGGSRAGETEQIETLEVSRIEANQLGDRVAEEHRLRANVAERLVECFQELRAGRRGFGHRILTLKVSFISRYLLQEGSMV